MLENSAAAALHAAVLLLGGDHASVLSRDA
jgi:hypothetical protein